VARRIVIMQVRVYKLIAMINRYAVAIVTIAGTLALISGLIFWFGGAPSLVSMHMLLGFLTVAGLWTIAIAQALSNGGSWILAVIALVVGGLTIYVGMNQAALLPGDNHWLIQLGHLLLGILTIGVAHMAVARQRRAAAG